MLISKSVRWIRHVCCLSLILGVQSLVYAQTPQAQSTQVSQATQATQATQANQAMHSAPDQADLDKGLALAKSKTCLGCHQIDSKRVGPAFIQVAERHNKTPGSLDYLTTAIRQGGRGRWGAVPMPAQTQVNDAESRLIAQWILSLTP